MRRITGTLQEYVCNFMIISPELFLEWEMFQIKVVDKIGTHFMVKNVFPKILPFMRYVDKWGTVRRSADDNIIGGMHIVCWTNKARDTHSEYVILIVSPWQKWFGETPSVLRCTYTSCLRCLSLQGSCEIHCKIIWNRTQ